MKQFKLKKTQNILPKIVMYIYFLNNIYKLLLQKKIRTINLLREKKA